MKGYFVVVDDNFFVKLYEQDLFGGSVIHITNNEREADKFPGLVAREIASKLRELGKESVKLEEVKMKKFKNIENFKEAISFFKEAGLVPVFNEDHSLNEVDTESSVYLVHYLLDNAKNSAVRAAVHKFFNCTAYYESAGEYDFVCLQNNYVEAADEVGLIQLKEVSGHNGDEKVLKEEYSKFKF